MKLPPTKPLSQKSSYPGLHPTETRILNQALRRNMLPMTPCIFNLHVGTSAPIPQNSAPNYRKMVETLSTLRIDLVLLLLTHTWVIEIKPYAGLTALGQAIAYTYLLHRDYPDLPNPIPVILTDTPQPDLFELSYHFHVLLIPTT